MTLHNIKDMAETGAKVTREYKRIEPIYLRKLANKCATQAEAAALIGITSTTLATYIRDNEATQAMEMAAQFVYERDYPDNGGGQKAKPVAAIVQGELHHIKTVKDMVEMLGGKFTFLEL